MNDNENTVENKECIVNHTISPAEFEKQMVITMTSGKSKLDRLKSAADIMCSVLAGLGYHRGVVEYCIRKDNRVPRKKKTTTTTTENSAATINHHDMTNINYTQNPSIPY